MRTPRDPAPVSDLRRVVADAVDRSGGAPLWILTHRSPDPDALGALVGVRRLVEVGFELPARVATDGRIRRAENLAMVRELGLDFEPYAKLGSGPSAGVLLVDSQPGFGHTVLPEGVPVLAVFDHHEPRDAAALEGEVPHVDLRAGLGATSSLIYAYLRDQGLVLDEPTATALFCGVRFDTGDLAFDVSALDEEAYFETFRRADRRRIARIQRPDLPPEYYRELHRSLELTERHGSLVLGLLGRVENPESVAEMADFFLRMEGCGISVVGGAFEGVYSVSVRAEPGRGRAYRTLEQLLDGRGSFGGRGRVAGARIPVSGDEDLRSLEAGIRRRALDLLGDGGGAPIGLAAT